MDYQKGQQLEMEVVGIQVDSAGYNFIALTYKDDPSKSFRVYNILKCQYESLPKTLYVLVKSVEPFGKIKLKQDEGRLYREHYTIGKYYAFEIVELREDQNKKTFYVIEDDFASHRYYYQGEATHKVGDDIILEIDGFNEDGFLKFKSRDVSPSDVPIEVERAIEAPDNTQNQLALNNWNQLPVLDVPDEGETIELKTSIAFPPDANKGEANIDKQLKNIIKELAAFMNTEGGTLYIGIHDKTKKVVGIEGDYAHLNDGDEDDYSGSYSANNDGYQLKIRNTMDRLCQGFANSKISFEFLTLEGHNYCKITAKKANRPVFVLGTQLYVRQGNRVKQLKADDITNYIYERNLYEQMVLENLMDVENWRKIFKEAFPDRRVPENLPQLKKNDEVDYWIVWYHNSEWMRVREQQDPADNIAFQLPVYKNMSDSVVVFCYATGDVNTMRLSQFRYGANLNRLQSKGWCTNSKPKNIFLMRPGDFLVGYSLDGHGAEYVKLHAITDFKTTQAATNQGSRFIPAQGAQILTYAVLESHHRPKIEGLIVPKQRKAQEIGTPLNTQNHERSAEIEFLGNTLSQG